ncbi:hypothetical protein ACMFMG_009311 [Clarireedia jacksonii]
MVTEAANTEFAFVQVGTNGRVTDKKDLRTVRKHIMKDIGISRRIKKHPASRASAKGNHNALQSERLHQGYLDENLTVSIHTLGLPGAGRMNPFISYPVALEPDTLFLLDHVYSWSDPHLIPIRDTWLPLGLTDPALFYEVLSQIAANVFMLRNGDENIGDDPQSIVLHSRAINSVRRRLLDPVEGISDGIIGAILAFACFSHGTSNWADYDIHMDALYKIIQARRGISCLSTNPVLRQLVSGIDLAVTCFLEKPTTRFPLTGMSESCDVDASRPWPVPPTRSVTQSIWKHSFGSRSPLLAIFHDTTNFLMVLKSDLVRSHHHSDVPMCIDYSTLISLVNRLDAISIPVSAVTEDNLLEECSRLGASLLLGEISIHFSRSVCRDTQRDFHHNRATNLCALHDILVVNSLYRKWLLFKPLLNWCACLASALTPQESMRHDFLHLSVYASKLMGLENWDESLVAAGNMLWIGEILNDAFRNVTQGVSWDSF